MYYIISDLLHDDSLHGPLNLVSPGPVTNAEFTRALGHALRRPTLCPVSPRILRAAMGEMADEALLSSQRVVPRRLIDAGYEFRFVDIGKTLEHLINYKL